MTKVPKHTYRVAHDGDHAKILAVLDEVAAEVPMKLDAPAQKEAMKSIIAECCASGKSWVAVGDYGAVVGVALVKPDIFERALKKNNALALRYVGVSKNWCQRGIFAALMENVMIAKNAPLNASVLYGNKSAMADRLAKIGFEKVEADAKETKLRWDPAPPVLKN